MFPESVAFAFGSDDHCVMEPVAEGRRYDGGSEDVVPFGEASVRGEDHRAFFATRIDDLEEQACAALGDGRATDFIDDEQRDPREEVNCPGFFGELPLASGFREAVGEFGEGCLVDALSGFDGGTEGCCEVGLSGAGRSEEVDGFASPDEVELGQSGYSLPVDGWLESEVEAFDRFDGKEFRGSQGDVDSSRFAQGANPDEEGVDCFDGGEFALLEPLQRVVEHFERARHFQADHGGADAVDEFGHWRAPCCSRRRPTASKAAARFRHAALRLSQSNENRMHPDAGTGKYPFKTKPLSSRRLILSAAVVISEYMSVQ